MLEFLVEVTPQRVRQVFYGFLEIQMLDQIHWIEVTHNSICKKRNPIYVPWCFRVSHRGYML